MKAMITLLLLLWAGAFTHAQPQTFDALTATAYAQWKARDYPNAAKTFERAYKR
jgi:hypothetical protein